MSPYREHQTPPKERKPMPWWATRAIVAVSTPSIVGLAWAYLPHGGPAEGLIGSTGFLLVGTILQMVTIIDKKT